jgi:hypothetical protein
VGRTLLSAAFDLDVALAFWRFFGFNLIPNSLDKQSSSQRRRTRVSAPHSQPTQV